jgi:MinD-like ATPase involved in chromosome partitioning or flagellar assembly
MIDQATELRRLASRTGAPGGTSPALPRTIAISGGRAGVGATTVAVHLATALASEALRVVLIDADLHQADAAVRCGMPEGLSIGDVLAGRKSIHEALLRGPAGMQILAGSSAADARASAGPRAADRLLRQVQSLVPHADWLIVDAGHEPGEITARLWKAAEQVLLVTSPEAAAVMDTYALVKTLLKEQQLPAPLALVVNQAESADSAADVCRRIDQSCRRFLGLSVRLAGWIPLDPAATSAIGNAATDSQSPLADAVNRLARTMTAPRRTLPQRMAA